MPDLPVHPVELADEVLLQQCEIRFTRRGGPGGQHRNKTSTAAILKHKPSEIDAEASERRSQADNRNEALRRLRIRLALNLRAPVTTAEQLQQKYGGSSLRIAAANRDFSVALADILNRVHEARGEIGPVAKAWNTSPSQIIRFLKIDPIALQQINQLRENQDLHRLK